MITRQPQPLSLGDKQCYFESVIVHEFIHAIGFTHEQNRPDREDYVEVIYENIIDSAEFAYKKKENDWIYDTRYDWKSVMHYSNQFAINKSLPTMKSKVS